MKEQRKKKIDLQEVDPKRQPIDFNAQKLIEYISKQKNVKSVTSTFVIDDREIKLHDISLKARGPNEDDIFASDVDLHHNIRRGLSVVEIDGQYDFARKGLRKFFDVQYEDISPNVTLTKRVDSILRYYTLGRVYQSIDQEDTTIETYQLEKANGENAQISFCQKLDAWVICSKNVSVLVRDPKEIDQPMLQQQRYGFAKLIAQSWFEQIKTFDEVKIEKLKKFLSSHTFVGEYCGNPLHQHLVSYDQIHIRFYAIVDHNSSETCIHPIIALKTFDQIGLPRVKESSSKASNAQEFTQQTKELYHIVSGKSVEEEGEGIVVYFICGTNVLSLGKFKTLEYRLFRKLREKIKTLIQRGGGSDNTKIILGKFKAESEDLCKISKPSKPESYYYEVALNALKKVEKYLEDLKYQSTQAMEEEEQKNQDSKSTKEKFLEQKSKKLSEFISSQYITFITEIRRETETQTNNYNLHQALENLTEVQSFSDNEEESNQQSQAERLQQRQYKKTVYFFFPTTIPASGKTQFVRILKESLLNQDIEIFSISSDEIRKEVMNKYKNLPHDDAFDKSQKQANTIYSEQTKLVIDKALKSEKKKVVVFFDKNHPENALEYPIKLIKEAFEAHQDVKSVIIGVQPTGPKAESFLFPINYLLNCVQRSIDRKSHETLQGSPEKVAAVVVFFYTFFKYPSLNQNFDKILYFPFTQNTQLPADLLDYVETFLGKLRQAKKVNPDLIIVQFQEELNQIIKFAQSIQWEFPSHEEQLNSLKEVIC